MQSGYCPLPSELRPGGRAGIVYCSNVDFTDLQIIERSGAERRVPFISSPVMAKILPSASFLGYSYICRGCGRGWVVSFSP